MQTFLPLASFEKSLACLDYKRLGKQRVEAMQILKVLRGEAKPTKTGRIAWSNHPAVLMWKDYEEALALYMNTAIRLWVARGYKNNMSLAKIVERIEIPPWFGCKHFHASHRANLLRKDYEFYSRYGWSENPETPYFWPISHVEAETK
jgi:hypothetical protein